MKPGRVLFTTLMAMAMFVALTAATTPKNAKDVTLHYDATVAGSRLASGDYSVTWEAHSPAATVTFFKNGKIVAKAEGKVIDRGTRYSANQVVYSESANGGRVVQEIRFRGSSEVITFD